MRLCSRSCSRIWVLFCASAATHFSRSGTFVIQTERDFSSPWGKKASPADALSCKAHTALIFQPCHTHVNCFNGTSCVIVVVIKAPRWEKICAASEEKNCLLTKKISSHRTPGEFRSAVWDWIYLISRVESSTLFCSGHLGRWKL